MLVNGVEYLEYEKQVNVISNSEIIYAREFARMLISIRPEA